MNITTTQNAGHSRIKYLIYGESGAGKTSLTKTLPIGKTLLLSYESGTLVLADSKIDMVEVINNVMTPLEKFNSLKKSFEFVMQKDVIDKYEWLVIDSLTEVNAIVIDYEMSKITDSNGVVDSSKTLPVWGAVAKTMKTFIKSFRDIPHYNVAMTALSSVEKDDNGIRYMGIDITGKMALQCPAYFDEVFYLDVEKDTGKRTLITGKTPRLQAKDRSGKLLVREPADLLAIHNKITKPIEGEKK